MAHIIWDTRFLIIVNLTRFADGGHVADGGQSYF